MSNLASVIESSAILAAGKVPDPMFAALVVSVVAEAANQWEPILVTAPLIFEVAIAASDLTSALTIEPSAIPAEFTVLIAINLLPPVCYLRLARLCIQYNQYYQ